MPGIDTPRSSCQRFSTVHSMRLRATRLLGYTMLGLWLSVLIGATQAEAQVFHPVSASRDLTVYGLVYCLLPDEQHHASTDLTATVADTLWSLSECGAPWWESAEAITTQNTTILDNALNLSYWVYSSYGLSNPMNYSRARSTSDAGFTFRVDPGQVLAYRAGPKLTFLRLGTGQVTLRITVSGPNGVLDSLITRTIPSGYDERTVRATWSRVLPPGDYTIETHGRAEDGTIAWGRIEVRFTFYDVTAVKPTTWSSFKALYRD